MADEVLIETTSSQIVEVAVPGPQGPTGATGLTGPQGPTIATENAPATNNILWEARTTAFTAVSGGRYVASGTFTVTNPATGNNGELFQVVVASGTVTVNGVAYGASRWPITVARVSGAWTTLANSLTENLTLNGTNSTAPNQTAASGSSVMTRDLSDERYRRTYTATRTTSLSLNDTNYVVGLTFSDVPVGNYYLQGFLSTYGGINSSGVRRRIVGNTATIAGRRGYYINYFNAFVFTSNIASEQLLAGAPATAALPIYGSLNVSVAGSIDVEFAQNTAQATPSQLQAEAHLILTELP